MFNKNKHIHQWTEVKRTYTPGGSFKGRGASEKLLQQAIFGITNIEFKCECGKVDFRQVIGET